MWKYQTIETQASWSFPGHFVLLGKHINSKDDLQQAWTAYGYSLSPTYQIAKKNFFPY